MPVKKITDAQKEAIVTIYTSKDKPKTIKEIASFLGVSTRTVGRVLEEKGIDSPMKARFGNVNTEANKVIQLLYKHKIDPNMLEQILNTPALTPGNISVFLKKCNREQLAVILIGAGLILSDDPQKKSLAVQALYAAPEGKPIPKSAQLGFDLEAA